MQLGRYLDSYFFHDVCILSLPKCKANSIVSVILNSVRQHNHFIIQGNYKATCFNYRLVILRPILSIVSQDAMHALGSHCVYIYGIHQIKSFVSKGVTCKLCLQEYYCSMALQFL